MTKHTTEPWTDSASKEAGLILVLQGFMPICKLAWAEDAPTLRPTFEEAAANAQRIAACVNACAGIPTEALQDKSKFDLVVQSIMANVQRQVETGT